jgi:hypothetical protein
MRLSCVLYGFTLFTCATEEHGYRTTPVRLITNGFAVAIEFAGATSRIKFTIVARAERERPRAVDIATFAETFASMRSEIVDGRDGIGRQFAKGATGKVGR